MNSDWPAIPCGLVARSFFNDTFKLFYNLNETKILIPIDESGIAWKSDIENSFRNINDNEIKELNLTQNITKTKITDYTQVQWLDMSNGNKNYY
jgi:hypothetical protein